MEVTVVLFMGEREVFRQVVSLEEPAAAAAAEAAAPVEEVHASEEEVSAPAEMVVAEEPAAESPSVEAAAEAEPIDPLRNNNLEKKQSSEFWNDQLIARW